MRFKINKEFNRLTKIHEKEVEILPEAWNLLQEAIGGVAAFTNILQSWPNLDRMSEPELEDFLSQSVLRDFQKEELKNSANKLKYYQKKMFWHNSHKASLAWNEFHNFFVKNRIFMTFELQQLFKDIDSLMQEAKISRECDDDPKAWNEAYKKMRDEINPIRDSIEKKIQSRLHFEEAK